jgi:hypothetical protein
MRTDAIERSRSGHFEFRSSQRECYKDRLLEAPPLAISVSPRLLSRAAWTRSDHRVRASYRWTDRSSGFLRVGTPRLARSPGHRLRRQACRQRRGRDSMRRSFRTARPATACLLGATPAAPNPSRVVRIGPLHPTTLPLGRHPACRPGVVAPATPLRTRTRS